MLLSYRDVHLADRRKKQASCDIEVLNITLIHLFVDFYKMGTQRNAHGNFLTYDRGNGLSFYFSLTKRAICLKSIMFPMKCKRY